MRRTRHKQNTNQCLNRQHTSCAHVKSNNFTINIQQIKQNYYRDFSSNCAILWWSVVMKSEPVYVCKWFYCIPFSLSTKLVVESIYCSRTTLRLYVIATLLSLQKFNLTSESILRNLDVIKLNKFRVRYCVEQKYTFFKRPFHLTCFLSYGMHRTIHGWDKKVCVGDTQRVALKERVKKYVHFSHCREIPYRFT